MRKKYMRYYIGIDIGTGSTKALAISSAADTILHVAQHSYPTLEPGPHCMEQDPELIWNAFIFCIREITDFMKASPVAIGISSAMHSIIPVDSSGKHLMNSIIWADARSTQYAEQLLQSPEAADIYKNTGTPIHAMSPLSKLCWMLDNAPQIFTAAHKFISIKEYIWFKLFREFKIDYSIASCTGLFDIYQRTWYTPALKKALIDSTRLSEPVATTYSCSDLSTEVQSVLSLHHPVPFIIGASDGCLANLGSNATEMGVASLTIGTSGAVRMVSDKPRYNFKSMTFNYLLDERTFVCGGPINNGGVIWNWFIKNFMHEKLDNVDYTLLFDKVGKINPGADGLIFLPYLMGERAPIWNSKACGTFFGINIGHTQYHFARSVIEGICFALYSVANSMEESSGNINCIYASGGFVQSKEWLQILADIFNKKIYVQNTQDASAIGAALVAIKTNEELSGYPAFKSADKEEIIYPDSGHHQIYQTFYPLFLRLYTKLKDEMNSLFYLGSQNR
jgi:gluconokinase